MSSHNKRVASESNKGHKVSRKDCLPKCSLIMTSHLFFSNISYYNILCRCWSGLGPDKCAGILIKQQKLCKSFKTTYSWRADC